MTKMLIRFKVWIDGKLIPWERVKKDHDLMLKACENKEALAVPFTGFHDKEGVPVYLGDILQYIGEGTKRYEKIIEHFYVDWERGGFSIKMFERATNEPIDHPLSYPNDEHVRVIGNTFENTDLVSKLKRGSN